MNRLLSLGLGAGSALAVVTVAATTWLRPAAPSGIVAPLAALVGARPWLNIPALRLQDLRGKVVLINFWTYSCINSLRVLPYTRAWAQKYQDRGLVVIGVHAPEFAFERDLGNVTRATASLGLGYPVVMDNDHALWNAFGNQAWPGFFFIDAQGRVRTKLFGEGSYEQSERLIQQLLSETGAPASTDVADISGQGAQAAPDWPDMRSPETYVGYARGTGFASVGGVVAESPNVYRLAAPLRLNEWGLIGSWTVGPEFAVSNGGGASISYRFHARDLHLVLGLSSPDRGARFRVTLDGAAPGAEHGSDVDAHGWGTVQEDRLYQLVRQAGAVTDRTLQIEFLDPGVRAYSFTFG
jgi:thiol-disulfide isomerase/thioredoxin